MNDNRIKKLESKAKRIIYSSEKIPHIWRPEGGKIAISPSSFILDKLKELKREIVYSPYIFRAVLINPKDVDIIDKIEGRNLYLKGIDKPINGISELIFK
jgi:hypothetical protein